MPSIWKRIRQNNPDLIDMAIICLIVMLVIFLAKESFGQDVTIPATNPYLTLTRGASWGGTGRCQANTTGASQCGVNNVFVWTPPNPDSTVCVAITNNNPTSSHSISLSLQQTLDVSVTQFSNNTLPWAPVPISGTTFPVTIAAGDTNSFFFKSSSAAKLALQVTGAISAAGNPDTANIVVVQPSTAQFCGSALNSTFTSVQGDVSQDTAIPSTNNFPVLMGGSSYNAPIHIEALRVLDGASGTAQGNLQTGGFGGPFFVDQYNETGTSEQINTSTGAGNSPGHGFLKIQNYGTCSDATTGCAIILKETRKYGVMVEGPFAYSAAAEGSTTSNLSASVAHVDFVNPGAGIDVLDMGSTVAGSILEPNRLVVSCSATCDFTFTRDSNTGTTCTAVPITHPYDPTVLYTPLALNVTTNCAAAPTASATYFHIFLAAGQPFNIDLNGYWKGGRIGNSTTAGTAGGFSVFNGAALTGTMSVTLEWMEGR